MSLFICLVCQPLVKQKNLTNTQASKSHLHATALSLLASPTHTVLQGSVPALENTVVQEMLRELGAPAVLEQRLKHGAPRHSAPRM